MNFCSSLLFLHFFLIVICHSNTNEIAVYNTFYIPTIIVWTQANLARCFFGGSQPIVVQIFWNFKFVGYKNDSDGKTRILISMKYTKSCKNIESKILGNIAVCKILKRCNYLQQFAGPEWTDFHECVRMRTNVVNIQINTLYTLCFYVCVRLFVCFEHIQ